jgi:small-conductance mechanosensitive channel
MEFLSTQILGNSVQVWLTAMAIFGITFLVLWILQRTLVGRLRKLTAHTKTQWDDILVKALAQTKLIFLLIVGIFAASIFLQLSPRIQAAFEKLIIIALLVQAGIWIGVVIKGLLEQYHQRTLEKNPAAITTINVIGLVSKMTLWSIIVLLVLDNLGVNVTALVAGLGIGGIAVALALQNILGDLFSSLSIMLDKPFVVGDFVIVDDYMGSVEHIGLKTTRVRSLSGEQLVFSNSDLLKSRLRNYGRMYERRVVFSLGVTYETPREKLNLIPVIIRECIEAQEKIRFDRSHFMKYGDYALLFETVYYVLSPDYNIYMDIQQAIYFAIHERFEKEHIEFAYPTQKLFLSNSAESSNA